MDSTKINYDEFFIWQDKDIRFDVPKNQLALRVGEKIIDNLENIEDTKGCNGDIGTMLLTNLRLIWYCQTNVKINLTIGYDCILTSEVKQTNSKVIGDTTAIYLKCRFNNNRFEFVFNSLTNTDKIFVSFTNIYKAYDSSRLYREMKLKGFLTQDKALLSLPEEIMINKYTAVSNIQNDQPISGTCCITNVRIVWYSNNIDNFNFSLPWIQIKAIKHKDHPKFGKTVLIETNKQIGSSILMLKYGNTDNYENTIKELAYNHNRYLENPLLGVDFSKLNLLDEVNNNTKSNSLVINNTSNNIPPQTSKTSENIVDFENQKKNILNNLTSDTGKLSVITEINESKLDYSVMENNKINESNFNSGKINSGNNILSIIDNKTEQFNKMLNNFNDEVEIIHTNYFNEQPTMLHYMTSNQEKKNTINDISYCPELGIAIERLPDNVNIDNLWKIILN